MTTQSTLASLKEALQQPFAPETIQFLPKEIRTENGKQVCPALPYANKRVYEDRLNALVFGEWSTPATQPYAQGNKLIIPVTVIILGVAHTDYGEAFTDNDRQEWKHPRGRKHSHGSLFPGISSCLCQVLARALPLRSAQTDPSL